MSATAASKPVQVIQWATGRAGVAALRAIIERPDTELVGLYVSSPDKDGKDAGELCGLTPTGVAATRDARAFAGRAGRRCLL